MRGAKYCVRDDDGDEIAVVSSINEAIPVLQNSLEKIRGSGSVAVQLCMLKPHSAGGWKLSKINQDIGWQIEIVPLLCCAMVTRRSSIRPKKPDAPPRPICVMVFQTPRRTKMAFRGFLMKCSTCGQTLMDSASAFTRLRMRHAASVSRPFNVRQQSVAR